MSPVILSVMDVLLMILSALIVLGFLVFIHEGGHFLAARSFGVRVSEFMIGLPGPSLSFKKGETRFGITAILLGGYARVCGMENGEMSPYLQSVLASVYRRGTALLEDVAADCRISVEDAHYALDELVEWGSITPPHKKDTYNIYRTTELKITPKIEKKLKAAGLNWQARKEGESVDFPSERVLFEFEYQQQYRSLPFWKRSIILVAGPLVNIVFALLAFVVLYSIIGFDVQKEDGSLSHIVVSPLVAIQAGFSYIGMMIQAIISLFNPQTASETISQSTSVVGIAVLSKSAIEEGFTSALSFTAMLSVSLGLMNLLPIPPLDGGRFVIEVFQRIRRKNVGARVATAISYAGIALFLIFFLVMINQDVQRFIFGTIS